MCLIIYSKTGDLVKESHFRQGAADNEDGIGIMSEDGIEKFVGRKKVRRAWSYLRRLTTRGIPYAVHMRFATHGVIGRPNTHPFLIPGSLTYMMHNGVLWTSVCATYADSDTALFARNIMPAYLAKRDSGEMLWKHDLEVEASYNKLLLLDMDTRQFDIINEDLGTWLDGFWYSNLYSVPDKDKPASMRKSWKHLKWVSSPRLATPLPSGPTLRADAEDDDRRYDCYWQDKRSGFDWHDRATWDKYPLPGSWDDRFPLAEDVAENRAADADATDEWDRMDGIQQYV